MLKYKSSGKVKNQIRFIFVFLSGVMTLAAVNAFSSKSNAATFTVNTYADTQDINLQDGICGDVVFLCSLRAAISQANFDQSPDTIIVPAGIYTESLIALNEDANAGGDFDITSPITIIGAGPNLTIIQSIAISKSDTDNVSAPSGLLNERVFNILNGAAVTIDGVTVQNGNFDTNDFGGGIRVDGANSSLTLVNSIVANNRTAGSGGGIYVGSPTGTLRVINSTFTNNRAGRAGGAIFSDNSVTGTIQNSNISGNLVSSPDSDAFGGGIGIAGPGPNFTITGSDISQNTAQSGLALGVGSGGGISNEGATLTIRSSRISGNTAKIHAGLETVGTTTPAFTKVDFTTIDGNRASGGGFIIAQGGGVYNGSTTGVNATSRFTDCAITNNNAAGIPGFAGGIQNYSSGLGKAVTSFQNSTISGNSSFDAAGSFNAGDNSELAFSYCTIARNAAGRNGGGIYQDAFGTTIVQSSILANGVSVDGPNIFGNITSQGYNLIENAGGGNFAPATGDAFDSDPRLGALGNNGGPTLTLLPSAHGPAVNSIPIGANGCGATLADDQRGLNRPFGNGCDKGAVELQTTKTTVSGRVFGSDGVRSVGGALVTLADQTGGTARTVLTNSFGVYRFDDVQMDRSYLISVKTKKYRFASLVISVTDDITNLNFLGLE